MNGRAGARPGIIGRAADGRVALSGELERALDRVRAAARSAAGAESHEQRSLDLKDVIGEARLALALSTSLSNNFDSQRPSDAGPSTLSSPVSGISANEWLVRGVVHDLNNMLLVIQNCSEVMRQQPNLLTREAAVVQDAVLQAGRLIAKLVPAEPEIGRPAGLDLSQAVARFSGVIRALVGADVGVFTRLASDLPLVRCEETIVARVLSNLATNARDAMPNGGTLTIETRVSTFAPSQLETTDVESVVVLSVNDTGHGMDVDTRSRAFEPFFSTKGSGKTTGVGLTAVREMVQSLGGDVEMDSGLGRGTTVRVFLRCVSSSS
jgi:signal transduction histidine kinase